MAATPPFANLQIEFYHPCNQSMQRRMVMVHGGKFGAALALSLLVVGAVFAAEEAHHGGGMRPAGRQGEPHPGPQGYQRVTEPHGWDIRPTTVDRPSYQHNFQAARSFKIGPYHRPAGWTARRWGYGQILPRAYWAAPYVIGDYWLFALEVPPAGYEWVRDGNDALLVDTSSGEILQVEYGVFA
jgi:Ni/Co efflux regulator RcnB